MRVEKIELIGFKSFGDRTTFQLHPGITCIVGPNGCGKSNIVDAFKWVLGEQSAKSLRGGKMEEVIFAGSQAKKPKGMSEVTLTVTGLGSPDNGKDTPTSVTRRLYRSGDSDYLLNRTSCRLKDIRDIFLDTGLELKSYSILEQDRIGALLTARPEERRFVIEEVAGVVKYKVRRHEAQNKLDSSRNNLQRISDIIAEVKRQINSLDRQVRKAERYKRLMEELRSIELKIAKRDFTALNGQLEETLRHYEGNREEDSLLRAELAREEGEIETRRIGLLEKEKALDELQAELQAMEREMAETERALAVSRTEQEHWKAHIARLEEQKEENARKRESSEARKKESAVTKQSLREEMDALNADMSEKNGALEALRKEIEEMETLLEVKRRDSFRISEKLGELRNELHRLTSSGDALRERGDSIAREAGELQTQLSGTENALKEIESSMVGKNSELLVLKDERERLGEEITRHRERLGKMRTETAGAREELASASSRLESLKEMAFEESSAEALRDDIPILALISDAVEVPKEYERAIEAALRETINGFLVPSSDDVAPAVSALKAKELGRTAFMAADTPVRHTNPVLPAAAIARASDVVKAGEGFSAIVNNLLGSVAVVGDLAGALRMKGTEMTLVTLEGEVVEPSGAVIAGKSRGILAMKRQVRELDEEIESRMKKLDALEKDTSEEENLLLDKETSLSGLGEKTVELERELSLLRLSAENNTAESERTNRKLSLLRIEQDDIRREKEEIANLVGEKEAEIRAHEEQKAHVDQSLKGLQEEIGTKKAGYEKLHAEAVELRLTLTSKGERLGSLEKEERALEDMVEELEGKNEFINSEMASTRARIEENEAENAGKEETLKGFAVRAGELSEKITSRRDIIATGSDELMEKERGLKGLRQKIDDFSHRLSELEVRRTEHTLRMDNLRDNIKNTYGVSLEEMEAEGVTEEDEERLSELKNKIESLGPVSLGSIDEYEELKERYEFLAKQQEDLQKSIAELEEAIARINSTTRKRLREAYEALKVRFSEVFVRLFGGGRAELMLTDERNILETGIEIIAQPPGKKLQNISLLSGGEKTLTALALLFASFLIKPSPLCILDEADAALDEANTYKFAEMLRDLSREIQFIVVTHNKVTMEVANFIYGITMEEPGNSKAISLEMAEA